MYVAVAKLQQIAFLFFDFFVIAFTLQLVKAEAEDAHDIGDGKEGIGVDGLDVAQEHAQVGLSCHYHKNIALLLAVPAHGMKHRHSPAEIVCDGIGNLVILLGKDEYLHRLLHTGKEKIDGVAVHGDEYQAVGSIGNLADNIHLRSVGFERGTEHRSRDYDNVHRENQLARRSVAVLADNQRDDVRAAAGASLGYAGPDSDSRKDTSEHRAQKRAYGLGKVVEKFRRNYVRKYVQKDGSVGYGIHGLPSETFAEYGNSEDKEHDIDDEVAPSHRNMPTGSILYYR